MPREYLENDPKIAKSKLKNQRQSVKGFMNEAFGKRPVREDLVKLYLMNSESNPMPQPLSSSKAVYDSANKSADELEEEDLGFVSFLDRMKAEKKQTKLTLNGHLRRRSSIEQLQKQGILPLGYEVIDDETDSDEEFISFIDRLKTERKEHRKSIGDLHRRRPSIQDLENRGILKPGAYDLERKVCSVYVY